MKKIAFMFAAIVGISFLTLAFKGQQQQEPEITVKLTYTEWQNVMFIIDNAAVNGEVRKPLVQKIAGQFNAQVKAMQDTTKPKPDANTKAKPKN